MKKIISARRLSSFSAPASILLFVAACSSGGSGNQAPRLGAIDDVELFANEISLPIEVRVADRDAVSLTAMSSDPSIVPASGIEIRAEGSVFELLLTPVPATLGVASITVIATDSGGLTDQAEFQVVVTPQEVSFSRFLRDVFAAGPDQPATDVNTRVFLADAQDDDFADLLN
ncbi:MAG: hypothetical protein AAF583_13695 [Pseudomonadota bacterium]